MLIRKASFAILAALLVAGCAYPKQSTVQGGVSSSLSFSTLPPSAVVTVDGSVIGKAQDYSGAKMLAVPPGTHRVHVADGARILVDREVYVGRDSTVNVQAQ